MKTAEDYFDEGTYQDNVEEDLEAAIALYSEAIRLNPAFSEAIFNRAVDYEQLGDWARAIADYRKYTDLRPDEPTGHDCLASAYLYADAPRLRDVESALEHARRACFLASETEYHPHVTLAKAYAESGRHQDAIASQEKAINLASRDPEANDLFVPKMQQSLARYIEDYRAKMPWWKCW